MASIQPRRILPLCAVLIALVIGVADAGTAYAGTISIEWDRSQDPTVVGYRVSVGTSPGDYTETFDVGAATTFVYTTSDTRLRYLAVASYATGPVVGPLSEPIAAVPFNSGPTIPIGQPGDAQSFYQSLWRDAVTATSAGRGAAVADVLGTPTRASSRICWEPSLDCLTVRTMARRSASVTSLTAADDDRLFFIEDGTQLRVITGNTLQSRPLLVAQSRLTQLQQIVLDPAFINTGTAYVSEEVTSPGGDRVFNVVRYSVAANQAFNRSVVFTTPLTVSGQARFAVTSSGYLYIAIPGTILRLRVDGTVPAEQRGSAAYATGYSIPTAIAFDERTQRLWIAGVDDSGRSSVSAMGGPSSPAVVPLTAMTSGTDTAGANYLYLASADGALVRAETETTPTIGATWHLAISAGLVRDVTPAAAGGLFVAVEGQTSSGAPAASILRLTPAR